MQNYQHSGAIPPIGALLTMLISFSAAAVMGVCYTMLFYYIPFIYLNFLLTLGFGTILGLIVGGFARSGKIRNTTFVTLLGFLAACVGLYFAWGTTFFGIVEMGKLPETVVNLNIKAYDPMMIIALAQHLFKNGSWALRGGGNVTGWFLVAFWLVEAGMIFYFTLTNARDSITKDIFCEQCYEWIPTEIAQVLQGDKNDPAWEQIRMGMLAPLADMERYTGGDSFIKLSVSCCPNCSTTQYFSAHACQTKVDKDGDTSTSETPIIVHQQLTSTDVELVRNAGREPVVAQPDEAADGDGNDGADGLPNIVT